MLRKPPHVLVTTPESLYILLTAEKSRALFASVETVIVDEIHAMAADKRGSHLALTLARLDDLVAQASGRKPQRIGLSATVRPLEARRAVLEPERATIVNVGHRREMELAVEVPSDELGPVASGEMWAEIYDRVAALILSASDDAGLRRHAPHERARRVRAQRAARRRHRAAAPRQPVARDCASTPRRA